MNLLTKIQKTLNNAFSPEFLDVIDESHMHKKSSIAPSHIKIVIVSKTFEKMHLVQRERTILKKINPECETLHAISIKAYTEKEWKGTCPTSPQCSNRFH